MGKNTFVAIKHPFDKSQEILIYPTIEKRDRPQFEGEPVRQCKLAKFFCRKTIKTRPAFCQHHVGAISTRSIDAASGAKPRATPQSLGNTFMKPSRPRGRGSIIAVFCRLYGGSIPAETKGSSSTAELGATPQSTGSSYKSLKTRNAESSESKEAKAPYEQIPVAKPSTHQKSSKAWDSESSASKEAKAPSSLKDEQIPVVKPSTHKKSSRARDSESSASKEAKAPSSLKDEQILVVKPSTHKKSSKARDSESLASKTAKAPSSLKDEPIPVAKNNIHKKSSETRDPGPSASKEAKALKDEQIPIGTENMAKKPRKKMWVRLFEKMWIIPKEDSVTDATEKVSSSVKQKPAEENKDTKPPKKMWSKTSQKMWIVPKETSKVSPEASVAGASGKKQKKNLKVGFVEKKETRSPQNFKPVQVADPSDEDDATSERSLSDVSPLSKGKSSTGDERDLSSSLSEGDSSSVTEMSSMSTQDDRDGNRKFKNRMKERDESSVSEINSISTQDDRERYGDRKFKSRMILRDKIPVPEMNSLDDRGGDGDWKIPRDGSTVERNEAASTAGKRRRKPVIKRRKVINRPEIALTYEDTSEIYVSSDDDVFPNSRDIKKNYSFGDHLSQALWDKPPINGRKNDLQEGNEKALCAKFGKLMTDFKRDLKEIIGKPHKSSPNERLRRTHIWRGTSKDKL